MWDNRDYYNGISVLPFYGSEAYPQLPFEDCSEETYLSMLPALQAINLDSVYEEDGTTINLAAEVACQSGFCEVASL
jgi:hypothetical protein